MKRLSIILLSLVLLVTSLTTVFADAHSHGEMTAVTQAGGMPTASGKYYLDEDITLTSTWTVSSDITLCLNGHAIILNYSNGFGIQINTNGCLRINDCNNDTNHYFTIDDGGSTPGLWRLTTSTTENVVTGGIITGFNNTTSVNNRAVFRNYGKLFLNGGTVVGNTSCREDWLSAVVDNYGGIFYMNGGAIKGNYTGTYSLGVISNTAKGLFVLGDGVISDNTCSQVCVYNGSNASMILNGGQIVDNITKSHAVCNQSGGIQVSGPVVIKDNYLSETGAPGNFISDTSLIIGKDLTGADIYLKNNGFKTTGYSVFNDGKDLANFFTYDGEAGYKAIVNEIGEIEIVENSVVEPETNHEHTNMTPVSSAASLPTTSGTYYLTDNITLDSAWSITGVSSDNQVDIRLCLNGYTIDLNKKSININKFATLNIYDCDTTTKHYFDINADGLWTLTNTPTDNVVIGGIITGYSNTSGNGNAVSIAERGLFIMNGGTIIGNSITRGDWKGGIVRNAGVFCLNKGAIKGNLGINTTAGTVYNSTVFTMNGGEISNNNTAYISALYNEGSAALSNGLIENNVGTSDYSVKNNSCMSIFGPIVIKNNTKKADGSQYNFGISENKQVVLCGDISGADIQFECVGTDTAFGLNLNEYEGNNSTVLNYFHYDGVDGRKVTTNEKGDIKIEEDTDYHTITVDPEIIGAEISLNSYSSKLNDEIEVSVKVEDGYRLVGNPSATYNTSETCIVTPSGNNKYVFTMPNYGVVVSAETIKTYNITLPANLTGLTYTVHDDTNNVNITKDTNKSTSSKDVYVVDKDVNVTVTFAPTSGYKLDPASTNPVTITGINEDKVFSFDGLLLIPTVIELPKYTIPKTGIN